MYLTHLEKAVIVMGVITTLVCVVMALGCFVYGVHWIAWALGVGLALAAFSTGGTTYNRIRHPEMFRRY